MLTLNGETGMHAVLRDMFEVLLWAFKKLVWQ